MRPGHGSPRTSDFSKVDPSVPSSGLLWFGLSWKLFPPFRVVWRFPNFTRDGDSTPSRAFQTGGGAFAQDRCFAPIQLISPPQLSTAIQLCVPAPASTRETMFLPKMVFAHSSDKLSTTANLDERKFQGLPEFRLEFRRKQSLESHISEFTPNLSAWANVVTNAHSFGLNECGNTHNYIRF